MELILIPFSFSFVRALGLVTFLPFEVFTVGYGLRFLLAVLIGLSGLSQVTYLHQVTLLSYLVEFLMGFTVAFPAILLIQAADLWGDLYESLRGQTAGSIADPLFQGETSQLALLGKSLVWIGLISSGALETLLSQFLLSFKVSALDIALWQKCVVTFCRVFDATMSLALPFAALFLVIEVVAMLSAKLIPGVSMITETFSAKMLLGGVGLLAILDLQPLSSSRITLAAILPF